MKRTCQQVFLLFVIGLFVVAQVNGQNHISLAGEWKFRADSADVGEARHWETEIFTETVRLPGSTDEIGLGNRLPLFKSILGTGKLDGYPENADFGMLTRKHKYIGKAWYQKEVDIPRNSSGKLYSLQFERVMWRSKVWVDGKLVGEPIDYLSTPHRHCLGALAPGKHTITVQIDNRLIYPIGALAHSYCPHMQTQWNGVVGRIELVGTPLLSLEHDAVYPSFKEKKVTVKLDLVNKFDRPKKVKAQFVITEKSTGKVVARQTESFTAAAGASSVGCEIGLKGRILPWDEFTPELYQLLTTISFDGQSQSRTTGFGFRDLGVVDKHFTINGRKLIYRNSHEGMFFGKTGYPAMDVEYWREVWKVYKAHGLNAVRFHSACPPEAAFVAADELGLYMQVEFFWMDGWMGLKDLIGGGNETLNRYVQDELQQALKIYGNHPSMVLVSIGNELGGDFDRMGEWIDAAQKRDPRHFYAAGIAHNITVADDYVEYGGKGDALKQDGTDWDYADKYTRPAAHNYDAGYRREHLPEFTHETGQYIVHPLWSEIAKYDGVLSPDNFLYFREQAVKNGIDKMDGQFQKASGNINRICYKAEIEATLRTPQSAGYSLLSMVDYPGQGEAFIGWVDPFYQNKNFLTPEEFKAYGTHTVPLLRFAKFVWEEGEEFQARAEVANYGPQTLQQAEVRYTIKDESRVLKTGALPVCDIKQGGITSIGELSCLLEAGDHGRQLTLLLEIAGTGYKNSWTVWVFPKNKNSNEPKDVFVTASVAEALPVLREGGKVLLTANKLGTLKNRTYAAFNPVFWSATWFGGQDTEVSGSVIRNRHPAMKLFPTAEVADWQWKEICDGGRGFVLNELPKEYFPIVEPVNDYHYGNKLGSIFELTTVQGGRLLVCGYNITDDLDKRVASRQLRKSLLSYMASDEFAPRQRVDEDWLERTFVDLNVPLRKEAAFESALLYIKAGSNHTQPGAAAWVPEIDGVINEREFDYTVFCEGVWLDEKGSYWFGKKMKIVIDVKHPELMELKICFHDSNNSGRRGVVACEDMPAVELGKHTDETWITIPVTRENCLDGKLVVEITSNSGPNLMVTKLALMPK